MEDRNEKIKNGDTKETSKNIVIYVLKNVYINNHKVSNIDIENDYKPYSWNISISDNGQSLPEEVVGDNIHIFPNRKYKFYIYESICKKNI